MRIKHKVNVQISEDTEGKNKLFCPDDDLSEVVLDGYETQWAGPFKVAGGTTEALSLGDVSAPKGCFLRVDNDCQVSLNGGAAIQLRKGSTLAGSTARLFLEADISSVQITAPGGTDVRGVFCVWGDAVSA